MVLLLFIMQYILKCFQAWYNRFTILRILITAGANVNVLTKNGNTPLHFAAEKKYDECARYLIIKGARKIKNKMNQYPGERYEADDHILYAKKTETPVIVEPEIQKIVIQGPIETISWNNAKDNPIIIQKKEEVKETLNIEEYDSDSDSGSSYDEIPTPKIIPNAPEYYDMSLTQLHIDTIFLESKMTHLQYFASIGDLFEVKKLILEGNIIDYRGEFGHTALMCAVYYIFK